MKKQFFGFLNDTHEFSGNDINDVYDELAKNIDKSKDWRITIWNEIGDLVLMVAELGK